MDSSVLGISNPTDYVHTILRKVTSKEESRSLAEITKLLSETLNSGAVLYHAEDIGATVKLVVQFVQF